MLKNIGSSMISMAKVTLDVAAKAHAEYHKQQAELYAAWHVTAGALETLFGLAHADGTRCVDIARCPFHNEEA